MHKLQYVKQKHKNERRCHKSQVNGFFFQHRYFYYATEYHKYLYHSKTFELLLVPTRLSGYCHMYYSCIPHSSPVS